MNSQFHLQQAGPLRQLPPPPFLLHAKTQLLGCLAWSSRTPREVPQFLTLRLHPVQAANDLQHLWRAVRRAAAAFPFQHAQQVSDSRDQTACDCRESLTWNARCSVSSCRRSLSTAACACASETAAWALEVAAAWSCEGVFILKAIWV